MLDKKLGGRRKKLKTSKRSDHNYCKRSGRIVDSEKKNVNQQSLKEKSRKMAEGQRKSFHVKG